MLPVTGQVPFQVHVLGPQRLDWSGKFRRTFCDAGQKGLRGEGNSGKCPQGAEEDILIRMIDNIKQNNL